MKGLRIFERFGFDLPKQELRKMPPESTINYQTWLYKLKLRNWINTVTGEALTDYKPDYELIELLQNRIDTELE